MSCTTRERLLETPDMDDLVSDVREQDRALRDGVWVKEFTMRDEGPRQLIGWIVMPVALVAFGGIALVVLYNIAGGAARFAAGLAVMVVGVTLVVWLRRRMRSAKRLTQDADR